MADEIIQQQSFICICFFCQKTITTANKELLLELLTQQSPAECEVNSVHVWLDEKALPHLKNALRVTPKGFITPPPLREDTTHETHVKLYNQSLKDLGKKRFYAVKDKKPLFKRLSIWLNKPYERVRA